MAAKKHRSILAFFLIIILFVNLVNVQSVLADGETPTEPPAATEVVTEEATEPPVEATSVPVESTPEPVETEATATPIAEILTEVPESTEVVVLDESGNSVPLVTEEAAESVEILDPMWCPAGVLPGGAGCTGNYNSVSELVTAMAGDPLFYNEPGIIYFIATTGNQAAGSFSATTQSLGTNSYNTINDFNLTLQGGWNGQNLANATFTGVTNFGTNPVTIGTSVNRWVGNITINNIQFNGVSSSNAALTVFTTSGSITLNNVDVNQQGNANTTAHLNSTSGNIVVQNGSTFDGNGSNSSGFIASTGGSGSIFISDTTFTDVVRLGPVVTNDGATLSAPTVTLTNVTATNNDGNGIRINNANTVTLNNVIANNNGTEGGAPGLAGNVGSGVFISGNLSSPLIINGGTFNNNKRYGIETLNTAYVPLNPGPTNCIGNIGGCYSPTVITDSTPPVIIPNITGTGSNGWYRSDVTVTWSVTDIESQIGSSSGCSPSTLIAETSGTTLTCSATNKAGLSNSVSTTVKIDKTAPNLSLGNITTEATGPSGATVTYAASASDNFDPNVTPSCLPTSGSTFQLGSTTVSCSATDQAGNTANGSFQITVQDTTGPVIQPRADIYAETKFGEGAIINYTNPSASDVVDGPVAVNCSPASGSRFPLGTNLVTCTATDSNGNTATSYFAVYVNGKEKETPLVPSSSALIIPLTGADLLDLDCNSAFWTSGIKLSFLNLCDQQTTIHGVGANDLPTALPNGSTFVMGLDVDILTNGQLLKTLPNGTGIEMDFPTSSEGQYVVLYWNESKSQWIEVSTQINKNQISQTLKTGSGEELYQLSHSDTDAFYPILTTNNTGIFVLAKK
jgi:hypothetical protein